MRSERERKKGKKGVGIKERGKVEGNRNGKEKK